MPEDVRERAESSIGRDIVTNVTSIIALFENRDATKTSHERTALERQVDATDRKIDQLVYELYGLTDEEIQIVKEATA